ncbi:zinc ribbon domain-containing protein [Lactobacillus delbrueckii]|uniref:zinc ribbon domain-containing protein n=1 Tax=Lactobacillus delbrueckii TaxID=1584 RepID=UPI00054E9B88|nr:zinc ribbon domain-containing protein [Lactobacillus delbrueckii]MCD5515976.1 zinc ribbon domain-containing protein [Lactobacillus delbrueckii subsp. lactis]MCD5521864.1 zinc ribbon domain-containing protein [Lactobacillus delbrueckii subsp. lactis]MCT3484940.1 zinc ribbon domain-containing protein [Lactobacillus delbrueckii subsp. lactis]MCT3488467.1 zinc ribbon domain-containing protein [Lactobacillus delbrueckii subsp. lactis]
MKECPNCHAEMGADVNFCTNCGTDLRQVAVSEEKPAPAALEPKAAPVQEAEVKAEGQADSQASGQAENVLSTYWQWLLHAWKKPAETVAAEKWYGLTTLILEDLFFILAELAGMNNLARSLEISYPSFLSIITELKSSFSSYVIISVVLGQVVVLAINYFAMKRFAKSEFDFVGYLNRYAHLSAYSLILNVLFWLFALTGSLGLQGIVLNMTAVVGFLALIYVLLEEKAEKIDQMQFALVISIIVSIVVMIVVKMFFKEFAYEIASIADQLVNSLLGSHSY